MKKVFLVIAMFMLFMGVVNASSINGDYKGNPIIIVKSDGKQLQKDEVPAMIIDGHTMVPISLLRQIGIEVNWNADTYSVDVKLPQTQSQNTNNTNNSTEANSSNVNGSPVENGENGKFQFIGLNSYYKTVGFSTKQLHIAGQLKNISGKSTGIFAINLTVTFFDKNGLVVGTANGQTASLENGETGSFDITVWNNPVNSVTYEIKAKG